MTRTCTPALAVLCLACGAAPPPIAQPPAAAVLQPLPRGAFAAQATDAEPLPPARLRAMEGGGGGIDDWPVVEFDATGARTVSVVSAFTEGTVAYLERRTADGALVWTLEDPSSFLVALDRAGGALLVRDGDPAELTRIGADGRTAWTARGREVYALPSGGAIFRDASGSLRRLDRDGRELGTPVLPTLCDADPGSAGCAWALTSDDAVVVASLSLDLARSRVEKRELDGTSRWSIELPRAIGLVAADRSGGAVFWSSEDDHVIAVAADGSVRFDRPRPRAPEGTPAGLPLIATDDGGRVGIVVTHYTSGALLHSVHLLGADGELQWGSWAVGNLAFTSAAFDPAGRLAVAGQHWETDFLGVHYAPTGNTDAFYLQFEP
jgi:hypothetical protein